MKKNICLGFLVACAVGGSPLLSAEGADEGGALQRGEGGRRTRLSNGDFVHVWSTPGDYSFAVPGTGPVSFRYLVVGGGGAGGSGGGGGGPLVVLAKDGANAVAEIDAAEIVAAETMKERVGDRDLAGKEGVPAEPAPTAKEVPKYKFSSDLQVFLTRETRRPGFCAELKDRILAAWRRDLEGVFAKPRPGKPFASGDIRLVALSQLVNIGIPEIKPRGYVPRADKVAAVRAFAPEARTGAPNFDLRLLKMPDDVFACIRMGPSGQHTFLFVNFGDRPVDGEFVVL